MNTYTATFPFKGDFHFVTFNSDMLANNAVMEDDFSEYKYNHNGQYFDEKIWHKGKEYSVTCNFSDVSKFNVYDEEDSLVEEEIPFLVLKVENDNGETIYNIVDNI